MYVHQLDAGTITAAIRAYLDQVGPRPSINIHQNRMCTSTVFRDGATQMRCLTASNLGKKSICFGLLWNGRG